MIAAGIPPDVFYLNEFNFAYFASKGVLKDLTPFIKGDKGFKRESFYPDLWKHMQFDGKPYAIPQEVSPILLYYNVTAFSSAGVPLPTGDWDWSSFSGQAQKLSQNGKYAMFFPGSWWGRIGPWLFQNNASILDEKTRKATFSTPAAIEAVRYVLELRDKLRVIPDATVKGIDWDTSFSSGKVAMRLAGAWDIPGMRASKTKFDWDVVTMPKGKRKVTTAATLNYGISGNSKHPKEAWEFIKFVTGPEGQAFVAKMGMALPSIDDPDVERLFTHPTLPPKSANQFAVAARSLDLSMFRFQEFPQIMSIWSDELDKVWLGRRSIEDSLRTIDDRINKTVLK